MGIRQGVGKDIIGHAKRWTGSAYVDLARAWSWNGSSYDQIWPLPYLSYEDQFNRSDGDPGPAWSHYNAGLYSPSTPVISGGKIIAGVPTSGTSGDPNSVAIMFSTHVARLNYRNRRIQGLLSGAPSGLNAGLIPRMTVGGKAAHINVVNLTDHSGISNTNDCVVEATRATYPPAWGAGSDIYGVDTIDTLYIAYRIRAGIRVTLCTWDDTGGVVPVDAPEWGFYVAASRSGSTTTPGPGWDWITAEDLPPATGYQTSAGYRRTTQSVTTSYAQVQMTADPGFPGSTVSSGDVIVQSTGNAVLTARLQLANESLSARTGTVRIKRNGTVVATGTATSIPQLSNTTVSVASGTIACTAGDALRLEVVASGSNISVAVDPINMLRAAAAA